MDPQFPKPLPEHGTIGIVAPASGSDQQDLDKGIHILRQHGYDINVADNVTNRNHFLAGSWTIRLQEMLDFFKDDSIDAIICARGGDGAIHLLPDFIDELEGVAPKTFVGYSDITILQLALYQRYGWVTFSGPMVATELANKSESSSTVTHLLSMLTSEPMKWNLLPEDSSGIEIWHDGVAKGTLLGGCMALVCTLLGTPNSPDYRDAILILEDVDETPQRIDRMLHQFRIHGVFERISGLILGKFHNCFPEDPGESFTLKDLVLNATADYDFPVIANYPYGHGSGTRLTVPLGAPVRLETGPSISLECTYTHS
ncbi:MAG: LD-carboxypeptidase [Candidatus Marinimicrobia bacterium]|nr:LD-carboxypeptidase [Candidatus Neomarinimicrobiota bacterium]MCF7830033.1 LD-carboxypeptidase [Candidatus Neomarinimicrobiota bacterium]MCF7881925.1 LD-carboxypeptidase [Candidatus Neomarinimicrobiota bacterium]